MKIFKPSAHHSIPISWNWITLTGPDAKDFLHRLTTVHVKALQVGQGARGCFLTPQGKFRAYFTLWNFAPNEYAFELDGGAQGAWKSHLLSAIDQYTFAEKFTLTDLAEKLETVWLFPESESEMKQITQGSLNPDETIAIDEEIRICHQGNLDYGTTWITTWGRPGRLDQWTTQTFGNATLATPEEIELRRISSTTPKVESEVTEAVSPLELGLRRAVAEQKGCYPGQEVIEKILALGSPPKRLVRIEATGPLPKVGDSILNLAEPPAELGTITSVIESHGKTQALALVKKIHAKEGLDVRFSSSHDIQGVICQISKYD